jgi:hypothetical protein
VAGTVGARVMVTLRWRSVQGKPAARRGRKARDLGSERTGDRPAAGPAGDTSYEVRDVKANLARFTTALMLLALSALSLGAGMRWY